MEENQNIILSNDITSNINLEEQSVFGNEEIKQFNLSNSTFIDGTNVVPKIRIAKGKNYIPWGDANSVNSNNYPDKILSLYNNSPIHQNIINLKRHQIVGSGLSFDPKDPKAKETAEFLSNINSDGHDMQEILQFIATDLVLFNGFALLLTFDTKWETIQEVRHVEFNNLRCALPTPTGDIPGYYFSYSWNAYKPVRVYIPKFSTLIVEQNKKAYKQAMQDFTENNKLVDKNLLLGLDNTLIFYYKGFNNNCFYYPLPTYCAGITSIEATSYANQVALNTLKNGMSTLLHIHIPKLMDMEGQRRAFRDLGASYAGAKNSGKPFITFGKSAEADDKPTITPLPVSEMDKRYIVVNETSIQATMSCHGITHPMLVGIAVGGKLGLVNEIQNAQILFYYNVIQPLQHVITKQLNKLTSFNKLSTLSIYDNNPFGMGAIQSAGNAQGQQAGNNDETINPEVVQNVNTEENSANPEMTV